MILVLFIRHGGIVRQAIQERWHRFQAKRKNALPADEGRVKQTAPRNVTVASIREAMRTLYGRRWGRKVRILLISGTQVRVTGLSPMKPLLLVNREKTYVLMLLMLKVTNLLK
jgi:type VI secretion system protein ImpL